MLSTLVKCMRCAQTRAMCGVPWGVYGPRCGCAVAAARQRTGEAVKEWGSESRPYSRCDSIRPQTRTATPAEHATSTYICKQHVGSRLCVFLVPDVSALSQDLSPLPHGGRPTHTPLTIDSTLQQRARCVPACGTALGCNRGLPPHHPMHLGSTKGHRTERSNRRACLPLPSTRAVARRHAARAPMLSLVRLAHAHLFHCSVPALPSARPLIEAQSRHRRIARLNGQRALAGLR
jgi:hypothetical protein